MVRVALALQGGGAHGAFTWGVLHRLLEEDWIEIEGASGTSAGSMNACALATGLMADRSRAQAEIGHLWQAVSQAGRAVFNPFQSDPWRAALQFWNMDQSPMSQWADLVSPFISPYQLGAFAPDPLRQIIEQRFDFERLKSPDAMALWLCATNVRTNKAKLFSGPELSADALLASATLPQLKRAVIIEDEDGPQPYWDGGFVGNPVLKPLIQHLGAQDIIIVHVNPLCRDDLPITAREIEDRLNEITFNAALMRELDHVATLSRLLEKGYLQHPRIRAVRLHDIGADREMAKLGLKSKYDTSQAFLEFLFELGCDTGDRWLRGPGQSLGRESSLDLERFRIQ